MAHARGATVATNMARARWRGSRVAADALQSRLRFAKVRAPLRGCRVGGLGWPTEETMANRAIWGMRKRHEWLSKPLKAKKMKRSGRLRCGLQDALDRKAGAEPETQTQAES